MNEYFDEEAFLATLIEFDSDMCQICENECICTEPCDLFKSELGRLIQTKPQSYNGLEASLC